MVEGRIRAKAMGPCDQNGNFAGGRIMITQTFFADGKYIGVAPCPSQTRDIDGSYWHPRNVAYFCRYCGEIWGRVVLSCPSTWQTVYRECRIHAHLGHTLAGQLTDPHYDFPTQLTPTPDWSVEVLMWDFVSLTLLERQ